MRLTGHLLGVAVEALQLEPCTSTQPNFIQSLPKGGHTGGVGLPRFTAEQPLPMGPVHDHKGTLAGLPIRRYRSACDRRR